MAVLTAVTRLRLRLKLKTFFQLGLFAIVLCLATATRVSAQTAPTKEYQVKAAFLFNFAQFVEWPTNAYATPNAPLVIGVLGDDPFGTFLDETVRDEKVNGHPLVVQRFAKPEDIKTCHVLFLSRSEADHLDPVLDTLKGHNILTVADINGFEGHGGIIRFTTEKGKIRLRINLAAAKSENVTISSRLLKLADVVATAKN